MDYPTSGLSWVREIKICRKAKTHCMLNRIILRIRNHKSAVSQFYNGDISNADFEDILLNEIEFLQKDLEEKLNEDIELQNKILLDHFEAIKDIVRDNKIDNEVLRNLIYSEFNSTFLKKHLL